MAKFGCKCGFLLSNTESPNKIEYKVYSDCEWDMIINQETIDPINIPQPIFDVWKCPKCERVYIFKNDEVYRVYMVET